MRKHSIVPMLVPCAAAVSLFAMSEGRAEASTYKVGPGRTYSNLKQIAGSLKAGDIVEVDGNATYSGDVVLSRSGTTSAPIKIRGLRVNGKRPVLSGGTNTLEFRAHHYVFEGFDVTGGTSRCVFHHGNDITIRDSVVHNCPGQGILGADSDSGSLTLDYVEVYGSGYGTTRHQIYIATDESAFPGSVFRMQHCYVHDGKGGNNVKTRAQRNEIYYNWIEGAVYHELELIGPDGQDPSLAREDSDVVGNVFKKTQSFYVTRIGGDGTGETDGRYRFVNNTFLMNSSSSAAFRLFDGVQSVEMHNNVFFRPGGGPVRIMNESYVSWTTGSKIIAGQNNWIPSGSTYVPSQWASTRTGTNPGFVDIASDDVRIRSDSALRNKGTATPVGPSGYAFPSPLALPQWLPPWDGIEPVGTALPRVIEGTIDIGAFEYEGF